MTMALTLASRSGIGPWLVFVALCCAVLFVIWLLTRRR